MDYPGTPVDQATPAPVPAGGGSPSAAPNGDNYPGTPVESEQATTTAPGVGSVPIKPEEYGFHTGSADEVKDFAKSIGLDPDKISPDTLKYASYLAQSGQPDNTTVGTPNENSRVTEFQNVMKGVQNFTGGAIQTIAAPFESQQTKDDHALLKGVTDNVFERYVNGGQNIDEAGNYNEPEAQKAGEIALPAVGTVIGGTAAISKLGAVSKPLREWASRLTTPEWLMLSYAADKVGFPLPDFVKHLLHSKD